MIDRKCIGTDLSTNRVPDDCVAFATSSAVLYKSQRIPVPMPCLPSATSHREREGVCESTGSETQVDPVASDPTASPKELALTPP